MSSAGHRKTGSGVEGVHVYLLPSVFSLLVVFFLLSFMLLGRLDVFVVFLLAVNLNGFLLMWFGSHVDSTAALELPQRDIFVHAMLFGFAGLIAGMYVFGHKRHIEKFRNRLFALSAILLGLLAVGYAFNDSITSLARALI